MKILARGRRSNSDQLTQICRWSVVLNISSYLLKKSPLFAGKSKTKDFKEKDKKFRPVYAEF
jgi:hypothetical protein